MVRAEEFVKLVWTPLLEGWGYIYGTAGRLWTEALQRSWSEPPHKNYEKTKQYGARWIGKMVTDCSGLPLWALKQLGEEIVHHARYQYTDASKYRGKLVDGKRTDGKPMLPGTAVFLQGNQEHIHHVGVYVGHNICIEAKGTQWGVVTSEPEHWDHWGELKAVDYSGEIRRISEDKDGDVGEESVEHGSVQCGDVEVVDYTKAADIENEPIPEVPEHREDNDVLFRVIVDNPGAWLNVRSGPGTSYPVLFRVEKGDVAEVLAVSDDNKWDQIRCNGRIGWASAEYLSVVDEEPNAPDDLPEMEDAKSAIMNKISEAYGIIDELMIILDNIRQLASDVEEQNHG